MSIGYGIDSVAFGMYCVAFGVGLRLLYSWSLFATGLFPHVLQTVQSYCLHKWRCLLSN